MEALMAAVGMATPAGLNAYLALLIVGMAARFTTLIKLEAPYSLLTETWALLVLGLLVSIEVFADKIPAVDSINDAIGTVVRPTAGALLALAGTREIGMDPYLAAGLGLVLAGGVHGMKAFSRPVINGVSGGLLGPLVSILEDLVVVAGVVLTILAPVVGFIIAVGLIALLVFMASRLRRLLARLFSRPQAEAADR